MAYALLDLVVVDHDGLQDDVDDSACQEVCHDEVDSDDDQDELVDVVGDTLPDVLAEVSMKLLKVILQDVVCLFVHLDVDIVDVDGADVLPELLDVDELVGILEVVVSSCCTC